MRSIFKKLTFEDKFIRKYYCVHARRNYIKFIKKYNRKLARRKLKQLLNKKDIESEEYKK